ncbi:NUDIX domain-containing protein [Leptotrichia sp. OH3620_COT-345]|uniref:NUDIX domain-containing protein n=1 Tax=Leptotrichia sp. OH3620_COT-345 TaxID=2491048 RepID=UPI000F64D730|nr:NUDIX domain-containing protein [Leptotrichia sp. OH3620_COT-345]RRD40934.1 NUDIX domain-containing protein [Leptotrichia sp. OH3620_COT-345]
MQFHLNNDNVKFILSKLNENGTGFLVGGAVRDLIMGKNPEDYDFATDIEYRELKRIFSEFNPKEVGSHFGILMIKVNNVNYEIARFRKETGIFNSRHPKKIKFVKTIDTDLARRDFTINAMAYNEQLGLVDLFNGKKDLEKGVIKFVGNPKLRIEEDALRIMRAFRFISKLGFRIEKKTAEAIFIKRKFLNKISKERIFDELSRILLGQHMEKALNEMKRLGVLEMIIPEFKYTYDFNQNNPYHRDNLFKHILKTVDLCEFDLITRFSALFHDLGKINVKIIDKEGIFHYYGHEKESSIIAESRLKELRAPNDMIFSVKKIISNHMLVYNSPSDKTLKKLIIDLGEKNLERLINLFSSDILSKEPLKSHENKLSLENFKKRIENILEMGKILEIRDLDITGVDLINLKFDAKNIREIKNEIYENILEDKLKNEKEEIIKYLSEKYGIPEKIKHEKSCGAVILNSNSKKLLIVKMYNGNWGFAKGHMEKNETEKETAIREVKEETGTEIKIMEDFKESIKYVPNEKTLKEVVFFIGLTENEDIKIDKNEIEDFKWCKYNEAMKLITYKLQRDILEKVIKFIRDKNKNFEE